MNGELCTLALGITVALSWSWRTGWSAGGFVVPGLLAANLARLSALTWSMVLAGVLWLLLLLLERFVPLTGRNRTGVALLTALILRLVCAAYTPQSEWVGWVIPGLIAADAARQGAVPTFASLVTCTVVTAFGAGLAGWVA